MRTRNRKLVFLWLLASVIAGAASRIFAEQLPLVFATYAGDTLWAASLFWILALILERKSTMVLSLFALFLSFAVEFSQLYRAPWINSFRDTLLGSLTLGHAFMWSDLLCYILGILLAALVDAVWVSRKRESKSQAELS